MNQQQTTNLRGKLQKAFLDDRSLLNLMLAPGYMMLCQVTPPPNRMAQYWVVEDSPEFWAEFSRLGEFSGEILPIPMVRELFERRDIAYFCMEGKKNDHND